MKKEVLIAIFAAITLAVALWGYKFISGKNLFSGNYTFSAYYDNVQDVNTATPVQINGYEVGTVISISPDPNDVRRIQLVFTVKNSIKLPDYTVAELVPLSPLGGKYIELVFDRMCDGSNCAQDGAVLEGRNVGILSSLISEEELAGTADIITMVIDSTMDSFGAEDSDAAVDVGIRNLAVSLENFAEISDRFNTLMQNSAGNIETTFANISQLTNLLVDADAKIEKMLDDLSIVTDDLKDVKLSETIGVANSTLSQAESSMKSMDSTLTEATASLSELKILLEKINKGEGSLGKIMEEESLYTNLESSTRNLDLLIQDLRLNPRRYFSLFGKRSKPYEYPEEDPARQNDEGRQ